MLPHLVTWYHYLTAHAEGMIQLETLIWCHFWHGHLRGEIWNQLSACDVCSKMKKNSSKEGQLAPRNVPSVLWLEAHIDLIGPWEWKSQGVLAKFWAMTIIDPITDLVEIAGVTSTKSAKNVGTFKNTLSSQHPKWDKVVTDNDPKCSGNKWELMPMDRGIWKGTISFHTSMANTIIESSHQVTGQILHTTLHSTTVRTKAELMAAFDDVCACCPCYALCF